MFLLNAELAYEGVHISSILSASEMTVPIVGILGGVGSGKSSVVRHVTEFRLQIIDADQIGHSLLDDSRIQEQLRTAFGPLIFDNEGAVDRSRLASRVFGTTDQHRTSLQQLNDILHPAIRREMEQQIRTVSVETDAVIIDAALLLEAGWADACDRLIFVDTPETLRIERVRTNRGWSADELRRREQTQLPLSEKLRRSDDVVDNSGTLQDATRQMTSILRTIIQN